MHIAFVTTESPYDDRVGCGIAAYLRNIIPAIVDAGHRVTIVANAAAEKCFVVENDRVSVHHFRLPSLHWYAAKVPALRNIATLPLRQFEWSREFYRRAARASATTKIDVIEATEIGALFLSRIAPLVIRLHGSERIFREHSGVPLNAGVRWNDTLEARACERAAAITTPSKFHANEVAKRRGWDVARVQVIPNPIPDSLISAAATFKRNGHNERIVLYAGRLAPVKGIETLLEAAKLVRAIDPSISFVLAGPWQMPKSPESYGLNHQNGVRWIGAQGQQQLVEYYKTASIVVMPSNYETFGLSALEGVAFGNAVIATEGTAVSETLGQSGLATFVPRADAKALATRIVQQIASTKNTRGEIERALAPFHPQRVATETLRLYEAVAS